MEVPDTDLSLHRRLFRFLKAAADEFGQDMATRFAAALAFYTLFSLVPLLFLVVGTVGFISSETAVTQSDCNTVQASAIPSDSTNPLDRALLQVNEVAGSAVADPLAQLTCQAATYRQSFLWIGIALAAWSASAVLQHIQGILNFIFQVPPDETRGFFNAVIQRGIALVSAIVLSALVFAPILAVGAVNFLRDLFDVAWLRNLLSFLVPVTSLALLVVVVALTFQLLVRIKIPWQAARRGGLFTALIGLIGAFLVGFYLNRFAGGGALGAIGGVAILLFFFNLMWAIYLFGAEMTKVYADYLVYGDIVAPSHRENDRRPEVVERPVPESALRTGVVAFAIGWVTGWLARRR